MAQVHVGDVGTVFSGTIVDQAGAAVNVSTATVKELWFAKPDGGALIKSASFGTDGTNGVLTYTSLAGDLDKPGNWSVQGHVTMPSGEWHSDFGAFTVASNVR